MEKILLIWLGLVAVWPFAVLAAQWVTRTAGKVTGIEVADLLTGVGMNLISNGALIILTFIALWAIGIEIGTGKLAVLVLVLPVGGIIWLKGIQLKKANERD